MLVDIVAVETKLFLPFDSKYFLHELVGNGMMMYCIKSPNRLGVAVSL